MLPGRPPLRSPVLVQKDHSLVLLCYFPAWFCHLQPPARAQGIDIKSQKKRTACCRGAEIFCVVTDLPRRRESKRLNGQKVAPAATTAENSAELEVYSPVTRCLLKSSRACHRPNSATWLCRLPPSPSNAISSCLQLFSCSNLAQSPKMRNLVSAPYP